MPQNRFPDSAEKRELRRRDRRVIEQHVQLVGRKLDYCGMPSAEFLDVIEWQGSLRSVLALENDDDVLSDMSIQRDVLKLDVAIEIASGNILDFLTTTERSFDIYNLDFYGGFVYRDAAGHSRSVSAVRSLVATQAKHRKPFVLVSTFNVREKGARDYLEFIEDAERQLSTWPGSAENLSAHKKSQMSKLKLCFGFLCWQQAAAGGFEHVLHDACIYQSSATMVHFVQSFRIGAQRVIQAPTLEELVAIANRPVFELKGQIRGKRFDPPRIGVPGDA